MVVKIWCGSLASKPMRCGMEVVPHGHVSMIIQMLITFLMTPVAVGSNYSLSKIAHTIVSTPSKFT